MKKLKVKLMMSQWLTQIQSVSIFQSICIILTVIYLLQVVDHCDIIEYYDQNIIIDSDTETNNLVSDFSVR